MKYFDESTFDFNLDLEVASVSFELNFEKEGNKADRPANSRERWAGALMEVRSLFLVVTDIHTDGRQTGL